MADDIKKQLKKKLDFENERNKEVSVQCVGTWERLSSTTFKRCLLGGVTKNQTN